MILDADIVKEIGDPREVARELSKFRRGAKALSSKHSGMIDEYTNQWIAVSNGQVAARARTYRTLLAAIDSQKLPRESIIVRRIDRNQRTMILQGH